MIPRKLYDHCKENFGLQQVKSEWVELIKETEKLKPNYIVEIGAYSCGSAATFAHLSKNVISIDIKQRIIAKEKSKEIKKLCNYEFIKMDSHKTETLEALKGLIDNNYVDLLFIDGDHTYEGAKEDFLAYKNIVRSGGIIALHDIVESEYHKKLNCHVYKFWKEIKKEYHIREIIEGQEWGGIGVVYL